MCAKICHDLAAPVSAIAMGLEMLEDTRAANEATTRNLVIYSTRATAAKIEVFRCLTGFSSEQDKPTGNDLIRAVNNYWESSKLKLDWQAGEPEKIKGTPARLLLAVLLTAAEGLCHGGTLILHKNLNITAQGRAARLRDDNHVALTGQSALADQTVRTVVPFFAYLLAQGLGGKMVVEYEREDQFTVRFLSA